MNGYIMLFRFKKNSQFLCSDTNSKTDEYLLSETPKYNYVYKKNRNGINCFVERT